MEFLRLRQILCRFSFFCRPYSRLHLQCAALVRARHFPYPTKVVTAQVWRYGATVST